MGLQEKIHELNEVVVELERKNAFRSALRVREELLKATQQVFGEPSREADEQKFYLCRNVYFIATAHSSRSGGSSEAQHQRDSDGQRSSSSSVCGTMTVEQLLLFGERILSPKNTLPETQSAVQVIDIRGKILLTTAALLRVHRPRAALPIAQHAIVLLRQAAPSTGGVSIDVVTALLAMCALQSSSNHHEDALRTAMEALEMVKLLEGEAQSPSAEDDRNEVEVTNEGAPAYSERQQPASVQSNAARCKFGELHAACYYNVAVEQEYLGLFELALCSYQRGFELAFVELGELHPLSTRLKRSYAETFASLHFRHFGTQKPSIKAVFSSADRAVEKLNTSYFDTIAHKATLMKEAERAQKIVSHARAATSTALLSRTQMSLREKLKPQSAQSRSQMRFVSL